MLHTSASSPPWSGRISYWCGRMDFGWANGIILGEWNFHSPTSGRIFGNSPKSRRISHMCGRISYIWVGEFSGSILGGRIFTRRWANFSHTGGRIIRVDFGWANFSHLKNSGRIFTRRWANLSHVGGRIFRVNFRWAIFIHLKNSGRFFHTRVGEFLTHEWANFQGQFWVGECCTSQKQWAIFTHFVKEDPHLRQILDKEALASLLIWKIKTQRRVASLAMGTWPGLGSLVWCLLDNQAPGPGGVVDAWNAY